MRLKPGVWKRLSASSTSWADRRSQRINTRPQPLPRLTAPPSGMPRPGVADSIPAGGQTRRSPRTPCANGSRCARRECRFHAPRWEATLGVTCSPMGDDYESFEDRRIKHLELIQAVVGRLGNDGFLMKGWALTVAGAFLRVCYQQVELAASYRGPGPHDHLLGPRRVLPQVRAPLPVPLLESANKVRRHQTVFHGRDRELVYQEVRGTG